MPDPLSDLRRADAHARWAAADALALRPEAAAQLAAAPVLCAGWMDDCEDDEDCDEYAVVNGVAVVPVEGALMDRAGWWWDGYDAIAARVEKAHGDASVRAVMLDLDSPGGMVAGLFECMAALRAARVASGKRMVAWVGSGAYSAAYALASVCDEIVTGVTAGTGSVGVIASLVSRAAQLTAEGVDVRVVSSGVEKTDGHPALPISDAAEGRLRARVGELSAMLFDEVRIGRAGLTTDALMALDGGVRYGRAAVAAGLSDRVTTRAALLAELAASASTATKTNAPRGTTAAPVGRASRTNMDDTLLAAIAAATGETDPAKAAGALASLSARATAAEQSLSRMTADHNAALERAQAAEQRAEAMERAAEIEAAKASRQWTASLDGFLATLSVPQLRAWRATAPAAVPTGEIKAPAEAPRADSQLAPDVAEIVAKARAGGGWKALNAREKHAVKAANPKLAAELGATA